MSDKKRKRADNAERPRKRIASEAPHAQVIKVSLLPEEGWAPVIATTPGLSLSPNVSFEPYQNSRQNATARPTNASKSSVSTSEILLHSSTHPKLDYVARQENSGGAENLVKHYIGVYDPSKGEVQVVLARKLVVRGTLRGAATSAGDSQDKDRETAPTLSAKSTLSLAFGTKKVQKAIRSLTENAITSSPAKSSQVFAGGGSLDPLASAIVESMQEASGSMHTREELQIAVDEGKPRPKANLEAETPANVYKLEDLVGVDAMRTLMVKEWQDKVNSNTNIETGSLFVSKRIRRTVESGDVKRLKGLRYLLFLLDVLRCLEPKAKGIKRLPVKEKLMSALGSLGEGLLDGFRRKFTQDNQLTKWYIDNLMTHICALALIIDNYEVDVYDVREDLKLENKEIVQYFQEIGCTVSAPTDSERARTDLTKAAAVAHKMARLRLPLKFPKNRVFAARRK